MPVVVVDWLHQPPRAKLVIGQIQLWLILPLIFLRYTLIVVQVTERGPVAGFDCSAARWLVGNR